MPLEVALIMPQLIQDYSQVNVQLVADRSRMVEAVPRAAHHQMNRTDHLLFLRLSHINSSLNQHLYLSLRAQNAERLNSAASTNCQIK